MRRRAALAAASCVAVAIGITAAMAWAAPATIISSSAGDTFTAPVFSHDAGTKAIFTNAESLDTHNVHSEAPGPVAGSLFKSEDVTGLGSKPVEGTQSLSAGDYPFLCTYHPGMRATLRVVGTLPGGPPGASAKKKKKCKKLRGKKRRRCLRRARRK